MSTEETSEKQNTEVFYEESEANDQTKVEGEKETKPEETTEEGQSTSDKDESKNGESEAEGEGEKDQTTEELKSAEDLKIPDGAQLNAETVKEVFEEAKELGLNKAQAQAFLEARSLTNEQVEKKAAAAVENMKSVWLEEFKNDPEIGGEKAIETAEHAKRAVEAFASKEFKETLDNTGFGNHPEMLRMFAKIGQKMIANDSFVSGKSVSTTPKSTADVFYGDN